MEAVSQGAFSPKHRIILMAIAVMVALATFSSSLIELVNRWSRQEEYSHGYLIPLIALWLVWTRRDALRASLGKGSYAGLALIALSAAMLVVGELSALFLLSQVGFIVALMGIMLAFGGLSFLRVTFIPIVILAFSIPLPYFIDSMLSWRLQLISSELGVAFIRLFDIPVYLEGNVIDLGQYKLQVVDACSGLRYLYPLLSLGFLAAYFFHAPLWQRALVFLSTIPITIVMNSLRIGIVGIVVNSWGPQEADGWLHFFEGWIIFIACAILLVGLVGALTLLRGKRLFDVFHPPHVAPVPPSRFAAGDRAALAPLAAAFVLLCATGIAVQYIAKRSEILPDRTAFNRFPAQLGEWKGRASSLEPQVEHALGLTDYILADYQLPNGRPVNFYVAYYASQRQGVSPHSPAVCIPGNGWQITKLERTVLADDAINVSFPINRVVTSRGIHKQIVYYWFEQRGRKIANEYVSKWYLLSDAITKNRTDGALARLVTNVYSDETEADADRRLRAFVRDLMPKLGQYLPPETLAPVKPAQRPLGNSNS